MNMSTMNIAEIIHHERLAQAEQAQQWAQATVTIRLRDRIRRALGARLIHWGTQLYVPTSPVEAQA
jgi:hypothetical protein